MGMQGKLRKCMALEMLGHRMMVFGIHVNVGFIYYFVSVKARVKHSTVFLIEFFLCCSPTETVCNTICVFLSLILFFSPLPPVLWPHVLLAVTSANLASDVIMDLPALKPHGCFMTPGFANDSKKSCNKKKQQHRDPDLPQSHIQRLIWERKKIVCAINK